MISPEITGFLESLKSNNTRDWFQSNKKMYENARRAFELFINHAISLVNKIDKNGPILEAKDCIFRIYRDVRFSPDKSPYKTHFGAYIANGGRKSPFAGYYIHIEPGNSILAGGIYMPPPNILKAVRYEIMDNIDEFKKILNNDEFKQHFTSLYGEKLKNAPKDFPKDFPDIELLKYKHYTIFKDMTDDVLLEKKFLNTVSEVFKAMLPFNNFMNRVIREEL